MSTDGLRIWVEGLPNGAYAARSPEAAVAPQLAPTADAAIGRLVRALAESGRAGVELAEYGPVKTALVPQGG